MSSRPRGNRAAHCRTLASSPERSALPLRRFPAPFTAMLTPLLSAVLVSVSAGGVEQWCPSESVSTIPACPGGCAQLVRHVRAIEVDGVRHLAWTVNPSNGTLYTARQEPNGEWIYS